MGTAVGIPTGEDAFCLWQRMFPELFFQFVKEEVLALLGQAHLGSLEFYMDVGRSRLTPIPAQKYPHHWPVFPLGSAALGDQTQDHARV